MRRCTVAVWVVGAMSLSRGAGAEPAATESPAPGDAQPTAIPATTLRIDSVLAQEMTPSAFHHGGLYLRFGYAYEYAAVLGSGPSGSASVSGLASRFELSLGMTPWSGLVLGISLSLPEASGDFKGSPPGASGDAGIALPFIGAIVDWFPDPRGGWHTGGGFGLGGYVMEDRSHRDYRALTPEFALVGGFDTWIGSQYSVGFALTTHVATPAAAKDLYRQETGYRFTALSIGMQLSLLFH